MRALRLVMLVLLVIAAGLAVGVAVSDGSWRDLWLNLLAETAGAALIVFLVDRIIERGKVRDADERRRAAIKDLRLSLRELEEWLGRLLLGSAVVSGQTQALAPEAMPVDALLDDLPLRLGAVDFASPAPYKRDRYLVEWARRSFQETAVEFARWERNYAGSAGIFGADFRAAADKLHDVIREIGSFLEGMERYIVREEPSSAVYAYEGITELTEEGATLLASRLRDFLGFYRGQCDRLGVDPRVSRWH